MSGALWAAGVVAVEEAAAPTGEVLLRTSHPDEGALGDLVAAVSSLVPGARCRLVTLDDDRWLDAWKDHARPQVVGERLVVVPAWLAAGRPDARGGAAGDDGRTAVVLDPGRAFGSGGHATTRVALAALDALLADTVPTGDGPSVLDVGCGSGVLAIAALLLGAGRARAVDVDPEAVRATAENAAHNGVADRLEVDDRPLAELGGAYEAVVANLLAPVLVELAPALVARLAPGGHLVLAGMLAHQVDDVVAAVARASGADDPLAAGAAGADGLREVGRCAEDDWVAVVLARP